MRLIGIIAVGILIRRYVKPGAVKYKSLRRIGIMKEETEKKNSLDQLFDDFNKKTAEQFKDILAKIDVINSELREVAD
jgi:hypothetical protein